jgi:hypothetical protein
MPKETTPEVTETEEETKQEKASSGALEDVKPEVKEEPVQEEPKKRFNQFKGDGEVYLKQLEDAYQNSSTEGQRLSKDLTDREKEIETISKIVQSDPALKDQFQKKLYDTGYEDKYDDGELNANSIAQIVRQVVREEIPQQIDNAPALKRMDDERKQKDLTIYNDFAKEHPEIESDPTLAKDLEETFGIVAQRDTSKDGSIDFKKTLAKAWKIVTSEQEVENAKNLIQKESASMADTSSAVRTPEKKTELTELEKTIAGKFNLSEEQYLDGKKLGEQEETLTIN